MLHLDGYGLTDPYVAGSLFVYGFILLCVFLFCVISVLVQSVFVLVHCRDDALCFYGARSSYAGAHQDLLQKRCSPLLVEWTRLFVRFHLRRPCLGLVPSFAPRWRIALDVLFPVCPYVSCVPRPLTRLALSPSSTSEPLELASSFTASVGCGVWSPRQLIRPPKRLVVNKINMAPSV